MHYIPSEQWKESKVSPWVPVNRNNGARVYTKVPGIPKHIYFHFLFWASLYSSVGVVKILDSSIRRRTLRLREDRSLFKYLMEKEKSRECKSSVADWMIYPSSAFLSSLLCSVTNYKLFSPVPWTLQHLICTLCVHPKFSLLSVWLVANILSVLAPSPTPSQWALPLPPPVPSSTHGYSQNVSFPKAPLTLTYHVKTFQSWTRPSQHLLSTSSRPPGPWGSPFLLSTIFWLHSFLDRLRSNNPSLCLLLATILNSFTQLFFHLVPLENPYLVWTYIRHLCSYLECSVLMENNSAVAQTTVIISGWLATLSEPSELPGDTFIFS